MSVMPLVLVGSFAGQGLAAVVSIGCFCGLLVTTAFVLSAASIVAVTVAAR